MITKADETIEFETESERRGPDGPITLIWVLLSAGPTGWFLATGRAVQSLRGNDLRLSEKCLL